MRAKYSRTVSYVALDADLTARSAAFVRNQVKLHTVKSWLPTTPTETWVSCTALLPPKGSAHIKLGPPLGGKTHDAEDTRGRRRRRRKTQEAEDAALQCIVWRRSAHSSGGVAGICGGAARTQAEAQRAFERKTREGGRQGRKTHNAEDTRGGRREGRKKQETEDAAL